MIAHGVAFRFSPHYMNLRTSSCVHMCDVEPNVFDFLGGMVTWKWPVPCALGESRASDTPFSLFVLCLLEAFCLLFPLLL